MTSIEGLTMKDKNKFAKLQKIITTCNIAGLVIVLVVAMGISFIALSEVAYQFGIGYYESFFWPLLIDVPIAIFMTNILVNRWVANKHNAKFAKSMVVLFSLASVVFNVLHAKFPMAETVLFFVPIAVAAVPAIAIIASFHSSFNMLGTFAELQFAKTEPEKTQLQIPATVDPVAKPASKVQKRKPPKRKTMQKEERLAYIKNARLQNKTFATIAGELGISLSQASRLAKEA